MEKYIIKKGDVIKSKKDDSLWLVTDTTRKKKDDVRMDADWNEYKPGTKIIYYMHKNIGSTTTSRASQNFIRDNFDYYKKATKCSCPKCDKFHFKWEYGAEV